MMNITQERVSVGQQVKPRVEYFKLSPSTSRYHKLMAVARALNCRWQDIVRAAIDEYLSKFPPIDKKV